MMSNALSSHTVRVPPRQTAHVRSVHHLRVDHPESATSIGLTDVEWDENHKDDPAPPPRAALHLSTDPGHKLEDGKTSFSIEPTETVYVEIGNYSDTALLVTFEIRGKS